MSSDPETLLTTEIDNGDLNERLAAAGRGTSRLTLGLAAVALALVSFVGGIVMHSALAGPTPRGGLDTVRPPQGAQQPARGGTTAGTVDRIEGNTLYVKGRDGQEVKVELSDQTAVMITQRGTARDLTPGDTVAVQGDRTEPDTLTARQITKQPSR